MLIFALFLGLVLLTTPLQAAAAALVEAVQEGPGRFTLRAAALADVSAMELSIAYDRTALANPRVVQGPLLSGTMAAVNPNASGMIRIAAISSRPFLSGGVIATLTFEATGPGGSLSALSVRLSTLAGKSLPVSTRIINTPAQTQTGSTQPAALDAAGAAESRTNEQPAPTAPGRTTTFPLILGPNEQPVTGQTLTADQGPSDRTSLKTGQTPTALPKDASRQSSPDRSAQEAASQLSVKKVYTTESVLDRFTNFTGKQTPKNLAALFEQEQAIGFRQEPPVVLTDGKQKAILRFIASPGRKNADIALLSASLLSLTSDPDFTNTWIAGVLPAIGAVRAGISITQASFLMVVPLVVAPKADIDLDQSGSVTEEDFRLFLAEKGTSKKPRFDLNKDGKRDALDDYIFTANYLARTKSARAVKAAP